MKAGYFAIHFALLRLLLERMPLIGLVLARPQSNLHLYTVTLPVQSKRHQRVPLDVSLLEETRDLLPVDQ